MIKIIHIQTKKRKADQARCFLGSFFIFGVKCGFMLSWIHNYPAYSKERSGEGGYGSYEK